MGDFIRRLGKKVQGLLDRIFGKKNKEPQSSKYISCAKSYIDASNVGPTICIKDGATLGKVE